MRSWQGILRPKTATVGTRREHSKGDLVSLRCMGVRQTEFRALMALAVPIILINLGTQSLVTVDTIMIGRLSKEALAAAGIGAVWIMGTSMFAMGLLFGIDPIVTQAHGAGDGARCGLALQRGIVLGLAISPLLALAWLFTEKALLLNGQDPAIAAAAHRYTVTQIPSIPFFLVSVALRQYLQGRDIVKPILVVTILANLANASFNQMLIYGGFGIPALGLVGAGIATALTRGFLLIGMLAIVLRWKLHRGAWIAWSPAAWSRKGLAEVLSYGIPTSLQMGLEIWAFGAATLMAGALGTVSIGAHMIAMSLASNSFMVPLGVSLAVCTRVGNLIGAGRPAQARLAGWIALASGAGIMALAALIFLVFRHQLPHLYVQADEHEVLALATAVLPVVAAFQVFDGFQVVAAGILRGRGNTRPAAWFNLLGYWVLSLPIGWFLASRTSLGLAGVWWGLALGLAIVAVFLLAYIRRCYRSDVLAEGSLSSSASIPADNAGHTSEALAARGNSIVSTGSPSSSPSNAPSDPGVS